MDEFLQNEFAEFWIKNGILFFIYKPGITITLKTAKKIVEVRLQFQNERIHPVFCDMRGIKVIEKDARDYFAKEGSISAKAVAILVNPALTEGISRFYLEINKPVVPSKVFTDEEEALNYLEQFK